MRIEKWTGWVAALLFLVSCDSMSPQPKPVTFQRLAGQAQGTTYSIVYADPLSRDFGPQVDSILKAFDLSLSIYVDSSIISRLNRREEVVLDEHFKAVMRRSLEIYELTDGAFDITVAPLVRAWGFGLERRDQVGPELVDSLLTHVGSNKVRLDGDRVTTQDSLLTFDSNAIAQGYAVDVLGSFLREQGVVDFLVEIGGEVLASGDGPSGDAWRVGIDKPIEGSGFEDRQLEVAIRLRGRALATSGSYRKFYEQEDGTKYSHTIDPRTGYPVDHNLLSVTVLADDCMTADALATAFMVMGLEASMRFVEADPKLEAFFIHGDAQGYQTSHSAGLDSLLIELEPVP